ncbi:MAG TPA: hypothetical protein PLM75_02850, partial [bacterium]|nr:hypothetical protein [bacterium]
NSDEFVKFNELLFFLFQKQLFEMILSSTKTNTKILEQQIKAFIKKCCACINTLKNNYFRNF